MQHPYFLLIVLCLIFTVGCSDDDLSRPQAFTVSGVVSSDQVSTIEGVMVNSVVDTTFTDSLGHFTVEAHPRGAIEFTKIGFEKWIESVNERDSLNVTLLEIPPGSATQYDISFQNEICASGDTLETIVVEVKDFGEGTGTATWTSDKVWVLKNRVFVNEGQTLTIQPGTIVKAASGQGESAAALIVARGGQIIADGTAELPIIFTSLSDRILRAPDGSLCQSTNLTKNDRGLWGGVILLGRAVLNSSMGESHVEGVPASESRGLYGGTDDADNSGVLRYVSIRHAGTQLSLGNEINGLTLAGVGGGTTVEYVETFAIADDGFEFFGGKVDTRYLVSAFNSDDAFDYDEGWRGRNQFWFAWQEGNSDRGGEHDGGIDPKDAQPFATPVVFNATYRGPGTQTGKRAITFQDNAGGEYHNSIFLNYAFGIDLEYLGNSEQDAYGMFEAGFLVFQNNIFHDIGNEPVFALRNASPLPDADSQVAAASQSLASYFADPAVGNLIADPDMSLRWVPKSGGLGAQPGTVPSDAFFEETNFKGCFTPGAERWLDGWTRVGEEL